MSPPPSRRRGGPCGFSGKPQLAITARFVAGVPIFGMPAQRVTMLAAVRPEVVFHLAGCVIGARGLEAVLPTLEHNLHATVNLLIALTELGCGRIVLAGSLEEPAEGCSGVVQFSLCCLKVGGPRLRSYVSCLI